MSVLTTLLSFLLLTAVATAVGQEEQGNKTTQPVQKQTQHVAQGASAAEYRYIAQPGDSYSKMARKAVQTYGITSKLVLGHPQILAAETNLTIAAGSPLLNLGQTVTISQAAVKVAADAAKSLSADRIELWRQYIPGVDFNTNSVGEARRR